MPIEKIAKQKALFNFTSQLIATEASFSRSIAFSQKLPFTQDFAKRLRFDLNGYFFNNNL